VTTVLIAAPAHLTTLRERPELGDIIAFADADVLQALEAITSLRPDVIALEKQFADTSRGSALINRIEADPSLKGCEVRLVLHDGGDIMRRADDAAPEVSAPPASPAPLDFRGTRKAQRFNVSSDVTVQLEGNPAQLIDISAVGAQVLSPTILRPNQRVRFSLTTQPGAQRFKAAVVWASFELYQGSARYRAGIELLDGADSAAINRFIKKHKL
jgi:hypothetical protein